LGESGDKIAEILLRHLPPDFRDRIDLQLIYYNRTEGNVEYRDGSDLPSSVDAPVLIIDGAVHSGTSMYEAVKTLKGSGITDVITYSFVVKRSSFFIPNYFGILIDEHDRPYFQLDRIPNNLLREEAPFGVMRRISADDAASEKQFLETGVPSIDRTSLGDLWYADQTEGSQVYVYQYEDSVAAFISFKLESLGALYVDIIATDAKYRGRGLGGLLMRWAGTYARSCCCKSIDLRAHVDRLSFYEHYGFTVVGATIEIGAGEAYTLMRKQIIYTGNPVQLVGLQP
jgi:GNAT superfamily N-acetyltransferase